MRCREQFRAQVAARVQAASERGAAAEYGRSATVGRTFDGPVPRCTDSAQGDISAAFTMRCVSRHWPFRFNSGSGAMDVHATRICHSDRSRGIRERAEVQSSAARSS